MAVERYSCLKFVKTSNGAEQCQVMLSATKAIEDMGQMVTWVEPTAIVSKDSHVDKNSIYVLETFDIPVYHKLAGKTRVIGPTVVLNHLNFNLPLPASRQPLFTMTMHGVTVCFTQTGAREKRTKLMELVKLMGGKTSGNFTRHVTHLIAGQVGSTKYKVARSLGTPVLCPSWIDVCWEKGRSSVIKSTTEDIMRGHSCPPLSGCVISSTGFSLEGRARLKQLAEQNGAEYSSNLIRDSCTHLIVGDATSKKYQYAREWKIYCVCEEWIHQSVKTRYCMEETDYPVEKNTVVTEDPHKNLAVTGNPAENPAVMGESTVVNPTSSSNNNNSEINKQQQQQNNNNIVNERKRVADNDGKDYNDSVSKKIKLTPPTEDDDTDLLSQYQNAEMPATIDDDSTNQLFKGKQLSIDNCISGVTRSSIINETQSRGATIVSVSKPCDYHVTSLSHTSSLPSCNNANIVTLIWLERSLDADQLLDPSSHFLFKPLPVSLCDKALVGCVITISQYDSLEREHLACLGKSLGAIMQDCFARYPSKGLLATTHLLLREATGEKYQSSLLWGVNAVSDSWLFACAIAQIIVPPDNYIVKPQLQNDSINLPPSEAVNHTPQLEVADKGEESISSKSFYPNYDLQDISLANVTQSGGPNTQLAGMFDCNMNKALETIADAERQAADNCNVLEGVVIVVHRKLAARKGELHQLVTSLGGKWRTVFDKQCTHYLYQGKLSDIARDKLLQQSKGTNCIVVSYYWLLMCSQNGRREEEGLYPCNYDPNRAIPILSQRINNNEEQENRDENFPGNEECDQSDVVPPPTIHHEDSTDDILKRQYCEILQMIERKDQNKKGSKREGSCSPNKSRSPDSKRRAPWKFNRNGGSSSDNIHITDSQLMTVTYEHPEDRLQQELLLQMRVGHIVKEPVPATPTNPVINECKSSIKPHPSGRLTRSMSRMENQPLAPPIAPPTTLPIVTSCKETPSESLFVEETASHNGRVNTPAVNKPVVNKPVVNKPIFLLSSLNIQEKADYGSLIHDLGGEYFESDHYLPSCTHLVIGKASRTEKYLAACASGKWVLSRTYLEACRAESRFVEESDYEWGMQLLNGKTTALDEAPRKWREKIAAKVDKIKTGAFEGWKVILCVEPPKQNGLKRLLEAGGARVIPHFQVIKTDRITHAFLNPGWKLDPQLSIQMLVEKGVNCMRPDYIAEYLQRETLPSNEQFILPEALKIRNEM